MSEELEKARQMIGKPYVWLALGLLEGEASFAYALRKVLTAEFGPEKGSELVAKVWHLRAKLFAERFLRERSVEKPDISYVGLIAKAWWEREFAIPYEIVENTPDRHVGRIPMCPYWEVMRSIYGLGPTEVYVREALTETTVAEFKGIAEALGLNVEVEVRKLICCGDDECLFIVRRAR